MKTRTKRTVREIKRLLKLGATIFQDEKGYCVIHPPKRAFKNLHAEMPMEEHP